MDTSGISRLDTSIPAAPAAVAPSAAPVSWAVLPGVAVPAVAAGSNDTSNTGNTGNSNKPTKADVKKSVDEINRVVQNNSEVHFSIDESSGLSVVKVIDTQTKKVLRQFPSEQSLDIVKNLHNLKGLLIDSQA